MSSAQLTDAAAVRHRSLMFVASCIALVATAMSFAIRGDILGDLRSGFSMDNTQTGWVGGAWAWGFAGAILVGGPLCDLLGMRALMLLACAAHTSGLLLTVFAPSFWALFAGTLVMGTGNGLVEAAINPLVATLYPTQKTAKLNLLHAWFPGGIVIGGVIAYLMQAMETSRTDAGVALWNGVQLWQVKMLVIMVPIVVYGIMFVSMKLPPTERVAAGVTTKAMWLEALRPAFLLLVLCMMFTAATELGPNTWISNIMTDKLHIAGILVLAWINLVMCVGRFFAGPLAHAISPVGIVLCSAAVSAVGVVLTSYADAAWEAYAATFVFGMGVCFFWPTMLGMTSERFPRGGALLLGIMGAMGNVGVALSTPAMGRIRDVTGSPELSLRYVAVLPIVLVVVFGSIFIWDRLQGGYKPAVIGPTADTER